MNVGNVSILGKRGRDSQRARAFDKAQRCWRGVVAAGRFVNEVTNASESGAEFVLRRRAQRLGISDIYYLRPPSEVAPKARQEYVGHALAITVIEVVARKLSEMG